MNTIFPYMLQEIINVLKFSFLFILIESLFIIYAKKTRSLFMSIYYIDGIIESSASYLANLGKEAGSLVTDLAKKVSDYSLSLYNRMPETYRNKLVALHQNLSSRITPLKETYKENPLQCIICALATVILLGSCPELLIVGAIGFINNKVVQNKENGKIQILSKVNVGYAAIGALSCLVFAPSLLSIYTILVGSYKLGKIANNCYASIKNYEAPSISPQGDSSIASVSGNDSQQHSCESRQS
jgi:hypothetical protein